MRSLRGIFLKISYNPKNCIELIQVHNLFCIIIKNFSCIHDKTCIYMLNKLVLCNKLQYKKRKTKRKFIYSYLT